MKKTDATAIESFIAAHQRAWSRIARATCGDHEAEDVESIARLTCYEWVAQQTVDWTNPEVADRFIALLHCKLVKFSERLHRGAVRLDHAPPGSDFDRHPLAERLAAPGADPVELLMAAESLQDDRTLVDRSHSLAAAYVRLVRHYRNDAQAVADYLRISRHWLHDRIRWARALAEHQAPMPFPPSRKKLPLPRPWRQARPERTWHQLSLDLGHEPLLL